jgi:hypothetical protein
MAHVIPFPNNLFLPNSKFSQAISHSRDLSKCRSRNFHYQFHVAGMFFPHLKKSPCHMPFSIIQNFVYASCMLSTYITIRHLSSISPDVAALRLSKRKRLRQMLCHWHSDDTHSWYNFLYYVLILKDTQSDTFVARQATVCAKE